MSVSGKGQNIDKMQSGIVISSEKLFGLAFNIYLFENISFSLYSALIGITFQK